MLNLIASLRRHRYLVLELTKREFKDRYANQVLGSAWACLHPLLLMLLYAGVFNFVFAIRFGENGVDLPRDYTTYVLSGLVPWLFLQDVLGRAPDAILVHRSLLKQMAFPINVLPVKRALGSLPILFIGASFLALYQIYMFGSLPWTVLLWPPYMVLLVLFAVGLVFAIGSVGVYWRDLRELIVVFTSANLFLLPVLFPPNQTPGLLKAIFWLNPFSYPVWLHQDIMFYGSVVHPAAWILMTLIGAGTLMIGVETYQRLSPQFGDVI
jgi:lipopolysaccharide transport system permease protein